MRLSRYPQYKSFPLSEFLFFLIWNISERTKTTHGDQFKTRKDRDTWLCNQIKEEKTNLTNLETGLAELREAEENIKTELTQIDSVHQEKKEEIRDIKSRFLSH